MHGPARCGRTGIIQTKKNYAPALFQMRSLLILVVSGMAGTALVRSGKSLNASSDPASLHFSAALPLLGFSQSKAAMFVGVCVRVLLIAAVSFLSKNSK